MPSRRRPLYDSSSSEGSFQNQSVGGSRRRLPSPPSGILRNSASNRHVTIVDPSTISRRVDRIAGSLEDTSRNLKNVDNKLSDFRDLHDDSMSALTKLQDDLEGSLHRLRNTREKRSLHQSDLHPRRSTSMTRAEQGRSSPSHQYESDASDYLSRRSYRRPSSSLGFSRQSYGDGLTSSVHDKIHDLSSNQVRLEDELGDEISRRRKSERSLRDLNESGKVGTAADRVERRLKEIERGMNADRNNATQLASDVATDILRRSQSKLQEDDLVNRNRMMQVETSKRALEGELETTRRRLEQSEGGREALLSQIGELRSLINKSDKERTELHRKVEQHEIQERLKLERETEDRHRLAASERQDRERMRQESEIDELRTALKRSAGVVQLDETRRELEKSGRQRQQLSDHIEVLTKDLEKKEQAHARILNQHHDLQRAFDQSEHERDRLCNQLEDALKKLKELARDTEKNNEDLRRLQELKRESEKEIEDMRCAAQETIRQWKSKCRKQEKEIERLRESIDQINTKNEEILKENIAGKTQANNAYQQIENLRNEMEDLISKRVELDEKVRHRDEEIEHISEEKRLLVKQMKETMATSENLDIKIREMIDKLSATNQKLAKSEKEVESVTSLYNSAKQQTSEIQHDMRGLKLRCNELESELSSHNRERMNAEKCAGEAVEQLQAMKVELSAVHKQLQIERETHKKELKDLHSEIHAGEVQRMDAVQIVSKKADEERIFLEGEIHRINVEANEAKAGAREAQRQLAKANNEFGMLEKDAKELNVENKTWREKYITLKSTLESKCVDLSREGGKVQRLEDDLLWSRDQSRRLEQLIESANEVLSQDIGELELLVELRSVDESLRSSFAESFDRKGSLKGDSWIIALRKKLDLIKKEVRMKMEHRREALKQLKDQKQNMKELGRAMDETKRQLMCEVTEQNKMVDSLTKEKTSLLLENKEARLIVHDLEDRVTNLTADLENESRKERERIQQRYTKYKDTIDSLQAELEESRNRGRLRASSRGASGTSPSPIKRVTMADTTPTIHGYSPIRPKSSSPKYRPEKDR